MRGIEFFICFVTLVSIKNTRALKKDYLQDYFTSQITLENPRRDYLSSRILKSHSSALYSSNMDKTIYLFAPTGYGLVVSIRLVDLRPMYQDELKIFATLGEVNPVSFTNGENYRNRRFYQKEELTFYSPNGQVGIRFTTGPLYFTAGYDGFELVYTAVTTEYLCHVDLFRCDNGRCISRELVCDGHNHCGDQSSEKDCNYISFGSGEHVGISFGVIFLVIAAFCGIRIKNRISRRGALFSHNILINQPINPPPPPSSYI